MSAIDVDLLRDNVLNSAARLGADPGHGVVFPTVSSELGANVESSITFEQYGRRFEFGADESVGRAGTGRHPSPLRYLLASVAACLQVWCAKAAALEGAALDAVEIDVTCMLDMRGEHAVDLTPPHPQWFYADIRLRGPVDAEVAGRIVEDALRRCPVSSLIARAVPVHTRVSLGPDVVAGGVPAELRGVR